MTDVVSGGLAWGQAEIIDWLALNSYHLPGIISVRDLTPPEGVSNPDLAESALRALAARHAALRTKVVIPRFAPGYTLPVADRPTQFVDEEHGFLLSRWDDEGAYTAAEFLMRIGEGYDTGMSTLDPQRDPSLGMIYRRPDGRCGCLLVTSRLLTDGPGCKRLAEEYEVLVTGIAQTELPPSADPLTVAAAESGAPKQESSRRNVAQLEQILRDTPEHLLVRPEASRASATTTRSSRFAAHVAQLSQRFGIPQGGIVTVLVSLLQWREHGCETVLVRALTQLPPPVRGTSYVGPNAMPALSAVSVRPEWTLRELFARAWASIIGSYRRGVYDPAAFDLMQHELAAPLGRELLDGIVYLNYHSLPEIFDWHDEPDGEVELSHSPIHRHERVFRTLFDIREMATSMTLHVEGAWWAGTGDTRQQTGTLLDMTATIASETDDQATVGGVIGGRTCNHI